MNSTVMPSALSKWQGRLERMITLERVIWLLAVVVFVVAWNRGLHLLYAMFAFLVSALLISYLGAWWQLRGISAVLNLPNDGFAQQQIRASIHLNAKSKRYLLLAQLSHQHNILSDESFAVFDEVKGKTQQPLTLRFLRRGEHQFEQVNVTSYFPFGLVKLSKTLLVPCVSSVIYPKISPLRRLPEQHLLGSQIDGDIPQHLQKAEEDFAMVRAYRDGDEMRHMHWRMSAKHNQWIVKEFDSTKMPAIAVILNANPNWVIEDEFNPREHMLQVVASLAEKCAQDGCGLLVILSDDHHYQVKPYQRDLQPLLRELAIWQGGDGASAPGVSTQLNRFPLVINFSSSNDLAPSALPLMNYQHQMSICFDASSYPNLGINAAIKTTHYGRQTQIKLGSSSELWGIFG